MLPVNLIYMMSEQIDDISLQSMYKMQFPKVLVQNKLPIQFSAITENYPIFYHKTLNITKNLIEMWTYENMSR